jgi:hypothetical protein
VISSAIFALAVSDTVSSSVSTVYNGIRISSGSLQATIDLIKCPRNAAQPGREIKQPSPWQETAQWVRCLGHYFLKSLSALRSSTIYAKEARIQAGLYLDHSANVVLDEFEHLVGAMVHDHPSHRQCESFRFFMG